MSIVCQHHFVKHPNLEFTIYCEKCGKSKIVEHQCIWEREATIKRNDMTVGYILTGKICGYTNKYWI